MIGLQDRLHRGRIGGRVDRVQENRLDRRGGFAHRDLTLENPALHPCPQAHQCGRGRMHPTPYRQETTGGVDRLPEAAPKLGQGRDDKIADRVAGKGSALEAMLEQLGGGPVLRKGGQAIAYVSRRRDAQLGRQPPRRSPVVRHRNHRVDIVCVQKGGSERLGEPVAASDPDDPHPSLMGERGAGRRRGGSPWP